MPNTSVNLRTALHLRLGQQAAREGVTISDLVNDLLEKALRHRAGDRFLSHGAAEAGVDDLGVLAENYLRERLG